MLASYALSRTLVPTLVMYLMQHQSRQAGQAQGAPGKMRRIHLAFEAWFENLRQGYTVVLAALLQRKALFGGVFMAFSLLSAGLYTVLGQDFFPVVDAGQIRLHVRAPLGTRLEEMPAFVDKVEARIKQLIGKQELADMVDIVGGPYTPYNTLYNSNGTFDSSDVEILISLAKDHKPSAEHMRRLREVLTREFP